MINTTAITKQSKELNEQNYMQPVYVKTSMWSMKCEVID